MLCGMCLELVCPTVFLSGSTEVQMCLLVSSAAQCGIDDIPFLCALTALYEPTKSKPERELFSFLIERSTRFSPRISDQVKGPGEFKHITNRRKRN